MSRTAVRSVDDARLRRLRVDETIAHEVAVAYSDAPSKPSDPVVRAAYRQLADQADRWFAHLTGGATRRPVRVVFTRSSEAYRDASELGESVRSLSLLEVETAAYDRDRRHPLLDRSVGGVHDRFRAVHDIVSHGWLSHDFSRDGEFSAWLAEHRLYIGMARWALATELHAQHSVRWTSDDVAPFKAVLLDPRLLRASRHAGRPCASVS